MRISRRFRGFLRSAGFSAFQRVSQPVSGKPWDKIGNLSGSQFFAQNLLRVSPDAQSSHLLSCATSGAKSSACFACLCGMDIVMPQDRTCNYAEHYRNRRFAMRHLHVYAETEEQKRIGQRRCTMRGKIRIAFTDDEIRIIMRSLVELRNALIREGRYTDSVDEIMLKFMQAMLI